MGSSPSSAKNACYFFNKMEQHEPIFVSYPFTERDRKYHLEDLPEIRFLLHEA